MVIPEEINVLHIVNKSPSERNTLESCLRTIRKGSSILLIEDGVYGATKGNVLAEKLKAILPEVRVFSLAPDMEARGVLENAIEGVDMVDYAGFVELVAANKNVQSWL